MAYCEQCGNQLDEGVKFCTNCGAPVSQDAADESSADEIDAAAFFADDGEEENDEDESERENEAFFADDDDDDEDDDDDDDGVEDIEDGDEDICSKDLDLTRGYYMTIDGRSASMYMDNGQIVRTFRMRANVLQATTSGETVTIVTDDGYTTMFYWTGQLIRRTRNRR